MQKYRAYDTDIYVEEGNLASTRLLQSKTLSPLSKFISHEGVVKSIINCSFFAPQYVLGRNQGDERNDTHNDSEVFYDVVILKDGTHKAGKMNSWDYQNNVVCGFTAPALLIRNGKDVEEISSFYDRNILITKHPRTAFAILKDGRCLQLVTDGRGVNSSVGLTGFEVREFLKNKYNNIDVLAILDGGGSSELIVNKKIVNHLTDGSERAMFNGIAFIEKGTESEGKKVNKIPFLKRISKDGMKQSAFYNDVKVNPYADGTGENGTGLPNCVTFSFGRACELKGASVRDDIMLTRYPDAKRWWEVTKWQKVTSGFQVGDTLVWGGTYGHVATVEEVHSNYLKISQSNFTRVPSKMEENYYQCWDITIPKAGSVTPKIGLPFLGAIRNPYVGFIFVKRDLTKSQVEVKANAMRCRDDLLNVRSGLFIPEGLYNILETKQKDGYTWAKVYENMWFALNDKDGWTSTYLVEQSETHTSETHKEEQTPMEKQQVLEELKNALKQANEKLAELEKAESDKEAKIAQQEKELQELKDFKKKIKELLV